MAFGRSIVFDGAIYPAKKGAEHLDLAFGASGKAYINFTVATYGGKERDGANKDKLYHRCVAFGDLAEHIAESCKSGDEVIVVGALESNNWTPDDGEKKYGTQVMVDMLGISLRWDTAKSDKMWSDKPQQAGATQQASASKARVSKESTSGFSDAPFAPHVIG